MYDNKLYEEFCNRYYYLIDKYMNKYSLSEEYYGDISITFCEAIIRCINNGITKPSDMSVRVINSIVAKCKTIQNRINKRAKFEMESLDSLCDEWYSITDIPLKKEYDAYEIWEYINKLLTDTEYTVIVCRFYYQETLKEIADKLECSKESVRLIESKALSKIRINLNDKSCPFSSIRIWNMQNNLNGKVIV